MKNFLLFSVCCFCLVINCDLQTFSQTTESKKPKIKNFGSSLKRDPQENLYSPKKKREEINNSGDDEIIRVDTNIVVFDFLVLTPKGHAVSGLKKEDFVVTEDDQSQEIQTFTIGNDANIPRSIVLIIDHSGSQLAYLERSIKAAKFLVDKLRPNDLMAIVTDDVELIADYTNDKKKLKSKLDSLKKDFGAFGSFDSFVRKPLGKSKQFSALYAVLNEMFSAEDARPIVIFQTDGDQLLFLKGQFGNQIFPPSPYTEPTNFSFSDLLTMTDKSRASIYTVFPGVKLLGLSPEEKKIKLEKELEARTKALGISPKNIPKPSKEMAKRAEKIQELTKKYYPNGMPDNQEVLSELSRYSGGWIDFLETPEQADQIYSMILDQIDLRYIISFSPINETKDGKRRTVKVSVKNRPEYIVWGRKTYLAPKSD